MLDLRLDTYKCTVTSHCVVHFTNIARHLRWRTYKFFVTQ